MALARVATPVETVSTAALDRSGLADWQAAMTFTLQLDTLLRGTMPDATLKVQIHLDGQ